MKRLTIVLAIVNLFFSVTQGWAAPAFVQQASADISNTVAFGSNVTAGNLVGVCLRCGEGTETVSSITDSLGNGYTKVYWQPQTTDGHSLYAFYSKNILGGADTLTQTGCGAAGARWGIIEISGLDTSAPLDQFTSTEGLATTANSGSVTTTQASEWIWGCLGDGDVLPTAGAGWTSRAGVGKVQSEDQILSTTQTLAATSSNTLNKWTAGISTFKAAGAPPPATLSPTSMLMSGVGE